MTSQIGSTPSLSLISSKLVGRSLATDRFQISSLSTNQSTVIVVVAT